MAFAALFPARYRTVEEAKQAVEERAGGRDKMIYLDWQTGMTADARQVVLEDGAEFICFHAIERGRMVLSLHEARRDGTAGGLVMRVETER